MRRVLIRLAPVLRLTRVSTAFAAVGNVWFTILWTRAAEQESGSRFVETAPLWIVLGAAALSALGLFAFGTCLNDVLDVRRDRALRPERPVPSGRISREGASVLVAVSLLLAVVGSIPFGSASVSLTAALAAAILLYNAAGKFVPGVGMVMLGLIYAGHMLVPNPDLRFLWPVWVVMTHALVTACAAHIVSRRTPRVSRRAAFAVGFGWIFWTGVLGTLAWTRRGADNDTWPHWVPLAGAAWIVLLAAACVLWCSQRVAATGPGVRSGEKVHRYGALWLTLYSCAWLLASGYIGHGLIMVGLAAFGLAGITFLREWYALLEEPAGYRR
ncbi:MAG: UbiA family prenyltransferase [Phycisphaerales bacterium]|nr:UbiA family prenyltransferase [Phycisphaerales bacterium]